MKKLSCLIFILTLTVSSYAQFKSAVGNINGSFSGGGIIETDINKTIEGSVFFSEAWQVGGITAIDKFSLKNQFLKYNIQAQTVLIKVDDKRVKIAKARFIDNFQVTDNDGFTRNFVNAKKYKLDGRHLVGFVEALHQGDFDLVYRYTVSLKQADARPVYGVNTGEDAEFVTAIQLYSAKGGVLTEIKSKKDLLNLFGDKASEMKAYSKKNKIKIRDYQSMANAINHYKGA